MIIGNGGAELGVRGYVSAYDAETGAAGLALLHRARRSRRSRSSRPALERGREDLDAASGGRSAAAARSGTRSPTTRSSTCSTSAPATARPGAATSRSPGGGDNLYLSSILALRPDTGELVWHYQTTPGDSWDYTATQHMILADLDDRRAPRKVLMQAPKNGFFYVLDRATGELISAEPFVDGDLGERRRPRRPGGPIETPRRDYRDEAASR